MAEPAWVGRLQEAAYTSPGGTRVTFAYEDVSRVRTKRGTGFVYGDADGTFVQDRGMTGRRFPMRLFFSGSDHDIEADAFEELLGERGPGILEHPRYGRVGVVPLGDITQTDNLVTGANQTILELEFWETNEVIFPAAGRSPASVVRAQVAEHTDAAAEAFGEAIETDTVSEVAAMRDRTESRLTRVRELLDRITSVVSDAQERVRDIRRRYDQIYRSIVGTLNDLVQDPITLAYQTIALIQAPARAVLTRVAIFEGYGQMVRDLFTAGTWTIGLDNDNSNNFHTDDLIAQAAISAACESLVQAELRTRPEATNAAEDLLALWDEYVEWRDTNIESLGFVETGEAYGRLQQLVFTTAGALIQISFGLRTERRMTLMRARTPVDLAAELYGSVEDAVIDELIVINAFVGTEILEVPKGREVVWYG